MTLDQIQTLLGWSTIINMVLLMFWFAMLTALGDFVFGMHRRFFALSRQRFDEIHYAGLMYYKISVFFLFAIPYLVIRWFINV